MSKNTCGKCNRKEVVAKAVQYMKVLANLERMQVMCNICKQPHTVSELIAITGLSQPALSMHLARLRDEGMVTAEKSGRNVYYQVGDETLKDLVDYICNTFGCQ